MQRFYLHSPNVRVSQDLTHSRQFSQRPNVINGCHLRGGGVKKSHPKEIVAEEKVQCLQFISKNVAPLAVVMSLKCSMSLSKFKYSPECNLEIWCGPQVSRKQLVRFVLVIFARYIKVSLAQILAKKCTLWCNSNVTELLPFAGLFGACEKAM